MLGQIRERAGDVPLIGCTTAGQIATVGPSDAGVVVTALGGGFKFLIRDRGSKFTVGFDGVFNPCGRARFKIATSRHRDHERRSLVPFSQRLLG